MKKYIILNVLTFWMFISVGFAQKGIVINSGAKMQLFSGTTLIIGNDFGLTNNSTSSVFEGTVVFSGNTMQEIGGSESTNFSVLDIDNAGGVVLSVNTRVADELILTNGVFDIGDFNLTLSDISIISGTFSSFNMINADGTGVLTKEISGNDLFILPVGDLTLTADYSPVEFDFTSGIYTDASISVGVKNEKHINNSSTSDYLNRYWALSSSGITDFSCDMNFTYVSDDIVGNETNIYGVAWDNSSWTNIGQTSSLQFSGSLNSFSDVTGVESDLVGLNDLLNENLTVFYNNGTIFLNSRIDLNLQSIEIFDATGRLVFVENIKNAGNEEISFSNSTGYYFLKINSESLFYVKKVFID